RRFRCRGERRGRVFMVQRRPWAVCPGRVGDTARRLPRLDPFVLGDTMTSLRIVAMCMLVVAGSGCEKRSEFCADNPEAPGCGGGSGTDSGPGTCSPACAAPTPVCNSSNTCVACVTNADCTSALQPTCSDVGDPLGATCHGCESYLDCPDS